MVVPQLKISYKQYKITKQTEKGNGKSRIQKRSKREIQKKVWSAV
jgi:hypothetical protein